MKRKLIVLSQPNNGKHSADLGYFAASRQEFFSGIGSERIEEKSPGFFTSQDRYSILTESGLSLKVALQQSLFRFT